jgi:hypothetical protein
MNLYPRETDEFQPVTVTVDGVAVSSGVKFSVVVTTARPLVWVDPVSLSGKIGVMVSGLAPNDYRVYAQVTSSPEIPVVDCGTFRVI